MNDIWLNNGGFEADAGIKIPFLRKRSFDSLGRQEIKVLRIIDGNCSSCIGKNVKGRLWNELYIENPKYFSIKL